MTTRIPLSNLKPGQSGIIDTFLSDLNDHFRLKEMGLIPGTIVKCVRCAPFNGPVQIQVRGTSLFLRKAEASLVSLTLPK